MSLSNKKKQGQKYKKHGIRASHTCEVVLEDVKVPGSCLLGGKDKLDEKLARAREALTKPKTETSGKQPAMATFEATRPAVGAQAIGVARAAYEYALEYAGERQAFGKPIIMNQSIAFMLADMITEMNDQMLAAARELQFEVAARLRDELNELNEFNEFNQVNQLNEFNQFNEFNESNESNEFT